MKDGLTRLLTQSAVVTGLVFIATLFGAPSAGAQTVELDAQLLRAAFDEADTSRDGLIGEGEFAADIIAAFVTVDKDGNQKLSAEELGAVGVDSIGKLDTNSDGSVTIIEVMKVKVVEFESADANADGKLSIEEVAGFERRR